MFFRFVLIFQLALLVILNFYYFLWGRRPLNSGMAGFRHGGCMEKSIGTFRVHLTETGHRAVGSYARIWPKPFKFAIIFFILKNRSPFDDL